jgi:hypothetical protein
MAAFYLYSGIDLKDTKQRNHFIDTLVDNLLASINFREETGR